VLKPVGVFGSRFRTRLVLTWVIVRGYTNLARDQRTQPPILSGTRKWVPAKGQWQSSAAGKVTVGLAWQWSYVTDSAIYIGQQWR